MARIEKFKNGSAAFRVSDVVDEIEPLAWPGEFHAQDFANRGGWAIRHHHDAIGQEDGFVDIMGDHDHRILQAHVNIHD